MRLSVCGAMALMFALLGASGNASAAAGGASLKFDDHSGLASDGTFFINSPFVVSVVVSSPDDTPANRVQGAGYFFVASAANVLQVNGRTLGSDYTDSYATPLNTPFTLTPAETQNLGSSFVSPSSFRSAGDYLVADFTFTALSSGNFTINFDSSKAGTVYASSSAPGTDFTYASLGTYTVHAQAPEPACMPLLALLMAGLVRSRRRAA